MKFEYDFALFLLLQDVDFRGKSIKGSNAVDSKRFQIQQKIFYKSSKCKSLIVYSCSVQIKFDKYLLFIIAL